MTIDIAQGILIALAIRALIVHGWAAMSQQGFSQRLGGLIVAGTGFLAALVVMGS